LIFGTGALLMTNKTTQAPLAVTCGDPAGIGMEIFIAAQTEIGGDIPMVLFADRRHLRRVFRSRCFNPIRRPRRQITFGCIRSTSPSLRILANLIGATRPG